jgi:four helix bundle protein
VYLADQIRRAASSIPLDIAEGAGASAAADKARFYRIARRSATESAAILDVCLALNIANFDAVQKGPGAVAARGCHALLGWCSA